MMLDILEDYMDLRGLTYSRLDGTMGFNERERQVSSFWDCTIVHVQQWVKSHSTHTAVEVQLCRACVYITKIVYKKQGV